MQFLINMKIQMRLQKDFGPILQMDENKKWRRENIATLCFGTFKIKLEFGNIQLKLTKNIWNLVLAVFLIFYALIKKAGILSFSFFFLNYLQGDK